MNTKHSRNYCYQGKKMPLVCISGLALIVETAETAETTATSATGAKMLPVGNSDCVFCLTQFYYISQDCYYVTTFCIYLS